MTRGVSAALSDACTAAVPAAGAAAAPVSAVVVAGGSRLSPVCDVVGAFGSTTASGGGKRMFQPMNTAAQSTIVRSRFFMLF